MQNRPLERVVEDVADALVSIDRSGVSFKQFQLGVGPYGEPQLLSLVAGLLNRIESYSGKVQTKRNPDLLVPGEWAIECKIARPFGDNGKPAENWSVNMLHPYEGNTSLLGDCFKLLRLQGKERKAVMLIGYEHNPPVISLAPLISSFEVIANSVLRIQLGPRHERRKIDLVHPVHQQLTVCAWEVQESPDGNRAVR